MIKIVNKTDTVDEKNGQHIPEYTFFTGQYMKEVSPEERVFYKSSLVIVQFPNEKHSGNSWSTLSQFNVRNYKEVNAEIIITAK